MSMSFKTLLDNCEEADNMITTGWKNKNNTSGRKCICGSWKEHWIRFNHFKYLWPSKCSVNGCNNRATLGAHVINGNVAGEFIVPMCDSCNKRREEFDLDYGTSFASANKSKTCEKY